MIRRFLAMAGLTAALGLGSAHAQVYYSTPGYYAPPVATAPVYAAPVLAPPQIVYAQPAYVEPAYVEPIYAPGYYPYYGGYAYPRVDLDFGFFGGRRHFR